MIKLIMAANHPKTPTVLLVEDSEDDAFFFKRTFQKSGFACELHHVTDGAQAIDYLREAIKSNNSNLPRTIFLDLKMPVLNGFEVLDWIRAQRLAEPMEVVVLSGSEQEEDKARAASLGATHYLVKPIRVQQLQRILNDICPQEIGARI